MEYINQCKWPRRRYNIKIPSSKSQTAWWIKRIGTSCDSVRCSVNAWMHIATSAVMEHILYACGWGLVAACSIPLNTLCLIVLKHAKNIDPVTKIFLYSLTTSDLIYCLFRVVPAIFQNATGGVVLGDVFCFIQSFFAGASVQALYPVLLAVNIERYLSIEYPLKHRLMVTKQKARIIVSFVWICALIYCVCLGFLENWKSIFKPKLQLCGFSDDIRASHWQYKITRLGIFVKTAKLQLRSFSWPPRSYFQTFLGLSW